MEKNNTPPKAQKRPGWIYTPLALLVRPYAKFRFNLTYTGVKPKGPCILLSNHTSHPDFIFLAEMAFPEKITFLASYHWFTFKKFAPILNMAGCIPKYQFANDMMSMRRMKSVIDKNNGCVFIAPEGTIYAGGSLGYISPAIGKMIRFFRCPVYASKIEGAGLGNSKWTKKFHRGRVNVDTQLIVTPEEAGKLSVEEILERINTSLQYNDFEFQKRMNVRVKGKDKLEGFDTMYYKCPCCGKEFFIKSHGNTVECTACGAKAELGEDFRFTWQGDKQYFDNYVEWYDWQLDEMKKAVADPAFSLSEEVNYGIDVPGKNNYVIEGKGILTLDHTGWTYKGTLKGEEVEEHDDLSEVFLAVLKTGRHFELPFKNGHSRVFYPTANPKTSMRWHLASRAITELYEKK